MPDNPLQTTNIENKILVIRGQQVMLDRDLAELYGVETRVLNQAVKRNIERFPEDFMFMLETFEKNELITNCDRFNTMKHSSVLPYAFTEQGVAMLSSVLKSKEAADVNIKIMRAFVQMRHLMQSNVRLFAEIDSIKKHLLDSDIHHREHDKQIAELFSLMDKYNVNDTQGIFFQGQIFDAYAKFESFLQAATKEIILIDNYVDLSILQRLTKKQQHHPLPHRRISQRLRQKMLCVCDFGFVTDICDNGKFVKTFFLNPPKNPYINYKTTKRYFLPLHTKPRFISVFYALNHIK